MAHVLAVSNQKGGVGKTTTVINLASYWALAGYRTLIIDNDPQGNATTGLGLAPTDASIYRQGQPVATAWPNLSLVPAGRDLADREGAPIPHQALRTALTPLRTQFDLIIIDCPPTLAHLPINALVAADHLILPIQCEYFALEGMAQLLAFVEDLRAGTGTTVRLAGILLTMADPQHALSRQVEADIRAHFKEVALRTAIPRDIALAAAPSHGQPIASYEPLSPGSIAYCAVAKEILDGLER